VSPSPSRPKYFTDRSLGRNDLPTTLRALGWDLLPHSELYGPRDEEVSDVEWLEYCGRHNLPVLTKDKRLRHRPAEIAAIRSFGVKAFVLTSGSLRAEQQTERFHKNAKAIDAAAAGAGPVVYAIHADRIVLAA
jgi:PIN like domain